MPGQWNAFFRSLRLQLKQNFGNVGIANVSEVCYSVSVYEGCRVYIGNVEWWVTRDDTFWEV